MFIVSRALMATTLLFVGGIATSPADEPGLIAPDAENHALAVDEDYSSAPPTQVEPSNAAPLVPPSPPPAVGVPAAETPIQPVSGVIPSSVTTGGQACPSSGVCPYCGDPNCRRSVQRANCCDRIRGELYEHFGRGAPGYVYTPVPPAGSRLYAIVDWQITNGQAALQVLYDYDFIPNGATLSVRGRRQLQKIAQRAQRNHHPVIIESTPYQPALEQARWEHVVGEVSRLELPLVTERIIVAQPPGRQAEGEELPLLYNGFLGLGNLGAGSVGPPAAGSAGGGGGFGGP